MFICWKDKVAEKQSSICQFTPQVPTVGMAEPGWRLSSGDSIQIKPPLAAESEAEVGLELRQ